MHTPDPSSTVLRGAGCEFLPNDVRRLAAAVSSNAADFLDSDAMLADAFVRNADGSFSVNPDGRILSGHFPGMPIVPGVMAKRLIRALSSVDPYGFEDSDEGLVWKTEFPSAITPSGKPFRFKFGEGACALEAEGGTELVRTVLKETERGDSEAFLRSHHLRDTFHELVEKADRATVGTRLLQSDPFRFVTAAGEIF